MPARGEGDHSPKTLPEFQQRFANEEACIAYLYGKVKSGKADVTEFVDTFTWRPVATKKDLLGTYDLEIAFTKNKKNELVPTASKGALGFHTLSVHPDVVGKGKLVGLLENPALQMSRMNESERSAMASSYDVRAEKLEKVMKYVDRLTGGEGKGTGGRGFVG